MSVIQNIRDKYARWAVIAISLSLLGFIMMDAFAGKTGLFSGNRSNTIGKINGTSIDNVVFAKKVQVQQDMAKQQGYPMTAEQAVQTVWDQEVNQELLNEQYEKLGLTVSTKEINSFLFSQDAPEDFKKAFTDPKTGQFDPNLARQQFNMTKKQGTPEQKNQLAQYIDAQQKMLLMNKYNSLLTNSIYIPKWFIEKHNADNSLLAKVAYVSVPYSSIPDSSVKVSDDEISDFIQKHKSDYEQTEETRNISYVLFSARPSAADSAAARNSLLELKTTFDTAKNYDDLAIKAGSPVAFYDSYISKSAIQQPNKDSILNAPKGVVYGPYLDGGQGQEGQASQGVYALSKIIDEKTTPDTVKVRHILIATTQQNPNTGEKVQVRDDSSAKHLIDSVYHLLKTGTSFDTLVAKFSEDPGSKSKGGVYENITTGRMVAPFNDYIFLHKTGETGIIKTDFGYHLIEILSQKGSGPAYKVAYISKPIVASPETDNQANNEASLFAGDSRDLNSFNSNWEKKYKGKGINKLSASNIKPLDYSITGVNGTSRKFVKDIFEGSKGDVVGPERIGEDYVVGIITDINKAGLASVASVRTTIEPLLRNKKKAEQIKKNIGQISTLEAVSAKVHMPVQTADSLRLSGGPGALGYEAKVLGASFNPDNKGKVCNQAIAGTGGVYVLRVDNVSTTPVANADIEQQRKQMETQERQFMMYNQPTNALKKDAKIKDNRASFY